MQSGAAKMPNEARAPRPAGAPGPNCEPLIVTIAKADARHPRHSEAAVVERGDGTLLLAWQEFLASDLMGEDNAPDRIAAMTSSDGGRTWAGHRVLVETTPGDTNVYSPSFVTLTSGEVLFTYLRCHATGAGVPPRVSCHVDRSTDDGRTFQPFSVAWRNRPDTCASSTTKLLGSGRLVIPVARQVGADWSATDHYTCGCVYSDDGGRSWSESRTWVDLPLRGAMEPHIAELRDGGLIMVMRTQLGSLFGSLSADGGVTWSKPQTLGLRSPESCPELVTAPGTGDLLLVWNDSPYDPAWASHYGRRSPLSVAVSPDNGRTWRKLGNVAADPNACYSNPACTITRDGTVILTFFQLAYLPDGRMDNDRIDLKAALFKLDWLRS